MRQKPVSVLSLKKVSKIIRKKERQFREDVCLSFAPETLGENEEPLYHAHALMTQLAYYLEDAKLEIFKEIEIRSRRNL